jgi:hypothetical protein
VNDATYVTVLATCTDPTASGLVDASALLAKPQEVSLMLDGTEFFECQCHSDEHVLRLTLSLDDEDPEIYASVFLRQYRSFFKRLVIAVRYLFGYKCKYGHWDCFLMKPGDAMRMQGMLIRLIEVSTPEMLASRTAPQNGDSHK